LLSLSPIALTIQPKMNSSRLSGWIERNPIPSDKTKYNEFNVVEDITAQ